jgi:hypothetical protein
MKPTGRRRRAVAADNLRRESCGAALRGGRLAPGESRHLCPSSCDQRLNGLRPGARAHDLAVAITTRTDGLPRASVVNAGVLRHSLTEEPIVGFVSRGAARKLADLRERPHVTVVFRSGSEWIAIEATPSSLARSTRRVAGVRATAESCCGRSMPPLSTAPLTIGQGWTNRCLPKATAAFHGVTHGVPACRTARRPTWRECHGC